MTSGFDARRFFSYLFIFAIALVFILQFGPGSRGCNAPLTSSVKDAAARVNGQEISLTEFRRAYGQRLEALRMRGGGDLPEALARQFGIPGRVLDELITTELLEQAAEAHGITVSDTDLLDTIRKDPSFQKDGQFDPQTYSEVLQAYAKKTAPDYEAGLRRRLAAQRLLGMVAQTAEVSDDELRARFQREGDTVSLSLVKFDPAAYAAKIKAPTPAEVTAWEKAHGKEIAAYYEANKRTYSKGEQVRLKHILVRMNRNPSEDEKVKAHDRALELRKEIQGGKDFAQVAKESSDDPGSKMQGGELGWNERTAFVPSFAQAAFNLKIGELSEPVITPFGWHLLLVEEKKAPEEKPLASVSGEIAQVLLRKERASALAEADAKKASAALQKGTTLATQFPDKKDKDAQSVDAGEGPRAVDTGAFPKSAATIPRLGAAPELQAAAFAKDGPAPLPGMYRSGEAWVIAEVTARQKADDASFQARKSELREEAMRQRQAEIQESYLEALKKSATIVKNEALIAPAAAEG
ncbi:MAG TPA: SurA N-terminal domain-containing protein [Myxococcaceae bacterium]|nr:SurA N-terminal domain-containing protein [Myxococcaceae bacterium]